jgi:hypothetical protein
VLREERAHALAELRLKISVTGCGLFIEHSPYCAGFPRPALGQLTGPPAAYRTWPET